MYNLPEENNIFNIKKAQKSDRHEGKTCCLFRVSSLCISFFPLYRAILRFFLYTDI